MTNPTDESSKQTAPNGEAQQHQQQAPEEAPLEDEKKSPCSGSPSLISGAGTKRGREEDAGGSSGPKQALKNVEMEVSSGTPTCYVCKRTFLSWKAVFGHLRAHPNRKAPGAFPPPTFTPHGAPEKDNNGDDHKSDSQEQKLVPTLMNLARQTMEEMSSVNAIASPSPRRGLDIDLNEPIISYFLDLNEMPPPPNKDSEEDDKIEDEK